jgi:hypothetical protein
LIKPAPIRREIAVGEALTPAGHRDLAGFCLALSDWSAEVRILEVELMLDGTCEGPADDDLERFIQSCPIEYTEAA